eukprot:COSAG02_NODE_17238_length_1019_cov_1.020652_1_plen_35_part_10
MWCVAQGQRDGARTDADARGVVDAQAGVEAHSAPL